MPLTAEFIKIYKPKSRAGVIEKFLPDGTAILGGMFGRNTDFTKFIGLQVRVGD